MLKYQVRSNSRLAAYGSPSSSTHDTTLTSRSNSLASLNSVDSANSKGDWVTTKATTGLVRTLHRLDYTARPLQLQRCHPANMSRFILHMTSEGTLVRVHDHNISPRSNYKSLLLAEETTCREAIDILLSMN